VEASSRRGGNELNAERTSRALGPGQGPSQGPSQGPDLKGLVAEASEALARLDAARLEELALSCMALNRDWTAACGEDPARMEQEARAAQSEMATLARVLEATRSNLKVMRRLQEVCERRSGSMEGGAGAEWPGGDGYGHD
jgi:hypothetical protein